ARPEGRRAGRGGTLDSGLRRRTGSGGNACPRGGDRRTDTAGGARAHAGGRERAMTGALIGIGVAIVLLLIILPAAIKIVPEYQRMMVFRLGRAIGTKGPGLIFLIPIVDRGIRVDLRESYLEIPH